MSRLELRDLRKSYGALEVIKGATLDVEEGEFVVFVGPSGCGKSTLLRMIAGLEDISGGEISIGGKVVNHIAARDRGVAMVFQNYALYPHMSVRDNIGFGLRNLGVPRDEIATQVARAADVLQLGPYLDRRPKALSGGQRQRVAIGRAIVREPDVFLFDEPLSNLDASLRVQMRTEISRLHARLGATMIYVTHDQTEALTMADRIVVLRDGVIEQVGAPLELYDRPANRFVAGFLGAPKMNFLDGRVERVEGSGAEVRIAGGHALRVEAQGLAQGDAVTLGLRPEAMTLDVDGPFAGTVDLVEHLGNITLVHAILQDGETMIAELRDRAVPRMGQPVRFAASGAKVHVFDREGRALEARVSA